MKVSRPYQVAAIKSIWDFINNKNGNCLVVAPVGSGKSHIQAEFIRQVHEKFPRTKIIAMTHSKELLIQNSEELRQQYPEADYGFFCHSLNQKRTHNDIVFCSIQSIHNKISLFKRCPDIIIIDEIHLLSHNDQTTYRRFLNSVLEINPNAKIIGMTGSPFRSDTGRLDEGNGRIFDEVCYEISLKFMFEEGYLVRPVIPVVDTVMNVDGVRTRGGDYIASQLEAAVDIDETTKSCVREILSLSGNRKRWFGMTAGVKHCEHVRDALRIVGVKAEMILGETEAEDRQKIIKWFNEKSDDVRALVNVATLNVGFNCPHIDLLFPMRPTKSPVLYIQYTGRGLRPVYADGYDLNTKQGRLDAIAASDKPDVLFLDFGGIIKNLGAIDAINIKGKGHIEKEKEGVGEALYKLCPSCGETCAPAQMYCYKCSYCFIELTTSSEKEKNILTSDEPPETFKVLHMSMKEHRKKDDPTKPHTLCVTYSTLGGFFKEWVCFNHQGYARDKAVHWHLQRFPDTLPPANVNEALTICYPTPSHITVKKDGKFWRVISCEFNKKEELTMVNNNEEEIYDIPLY